MPMALSTTARMPEARPNRSAADTTIRSETTAMSWSSTQGRIAHPAANARPTITATGSAVRTDTST